MKRLLLTKGKFALVDNKDFLSLSLHKWYATRGRHTWYAVREVKKGGKKILLFLHREILKPTARNIFVDHRNGDGLDNRRKNIRLCSPETNSWNRKVRVDNSSGFKGVWFHKKVGKWTSQICFRGKKIHLGLFIRKLDAARAYKDASRKFFGKFSSV